MDAREECRLTLTLFLLAPPLVLLSFKYKTNRSNPMSLGVVVPSDSAKTSQEQNKQCERKRYASSKSNQYLYVETLIYLFFLLICLIAGE